MPQHITALDPLPGNGEYRYAVKLLDARTKAVLAQAERRVVVGAKAKGVDASDVLAAHHVIQLMEVVLNGEKLGEPAKRTVATLLEEEITKQVPGITVLRPSNGPAANATATPTHLVTGMVGLLGNTTILSIRLVNTSAGVVQMTSLDQLCDDRPSTLRLAVARAVGRFRGKTQPDVERVCAPAP